MNEVLAPTHAPPRNKRWRFKRLMWVAGLLVCGAFLVFRMGQWVKIQSQLAAIRTLGQPTTLRELDNWYLAVPPAENAALIYEKAFSKLQIEATADDLLQFEWTNSLARRIPISSEHKTLLTQLFAANDPALELLHSGAAFKKSRYSIDLKNGFNTPQPHLKKIKTCVQLMLVKAVSAAENGNPAEACQALLDTLQVARSLANEPLSAAATVEISLLQKIIQVLELLVSRTRFSDSQLALLSEELHETEDPNMPLRQMIGERCLGIFGFSLPAKAWAQSERESELSRRMTLQKIAGIWDQERITYLTIIGESIEAVKLPFPERVAKVRELAGRIGEKHDGDSEFVTFMGGHSAATLLFGNVEAEHIRAMELYARLAAARIALAVERYRLENLGMLPTKLDDLVPQYFSAVPLDSFDGNPYRFKRLSTGGYVVYSVGSDGNDDGGLAFGRKLREPYDVSFTVDSLAEP